MSKEYLEAFGRITSHTEYDNDSSYDCLNFEDDCKLVDEALERLEQIDNADPGKAMECLEYICKILKEKRIIDVKWVFKEDYNTINKALLKTQTQEKEKLFFKNIHNTKVKTPLVSIFEGLSQDERHKFTEHLYYHWEEMKEALEEQNKQLVEENIELKKKLNKHYLKWDDLEFGNEEKTMKVKLNNSIYTMVYYSDEVCFDTVSIDGVLIDCCSKQFFNDLHLEVLE